jgi:hypothetical protein
MMPDQWNVDSYARSKVVDLGRSLSARRAIYLDINFWIKLRDRERDRRAEELYDKLLSAVVSGDVFCPISQATFVEIMKQTDPGSRMRTAKVIDTLSMGVALIDEKLRIGTEVAHFLYGILQQTPLEPLKNLIWTKLSYVMGFVHPSSPHFDAESQKILQKMFVDHMWDRSLQEMLSDYDGQAFPGTDLSAIAALINEGNAAHGHSIRSYNQAYQDEARGAADLATSSALQVMEDFWRAAGTPAPEPTPDERALAELQFANLIGATLVHNKARDRLRTLHILASVHASVRWNKQQKVESNDIFDFDHAAAALAYCDAFFTERPLQTMVTQRHLSLHELYGCDVVSSVPEAVDYLSQLDYAR